VAAPYAQIWAAPATAGRSIPTSESLGCEHGLGMSELTDCVYAARARPSAWPPIPCA